MDIVDIVRLINTTNRRFSIIESSIMDYYTLLNNAFTVDEKILKALEMNNRKILKTTRNKAIEQDLVEHAEEYKNNVYEIASKAVTNSKFDNDVSVISKNKVRYASSKIKALYKKFGTEYIASLIFRLSQQYVPVKTGALRDSGKIEYLEDKGITRIVYGEGLSYGVFVHEMMDKTHIIGRAKFLEDAAYTVLNLVHNGDKPLFTFKLILDNNLVILEINSINIEEFMDNEEEKNKINGIDELDTLKYTGGDDSDK